MQPYRLINLYLSSLLALLIIGCSPLRGYQLKKSSVVTEKEVLPIIKKDNPLLYKARIDVYNRHYGGLVFLKQLNDSVSHLTFITEIGMKMFDFEIKNTTFKLVYIFEPLNTPRITGLLESDMKLLLLQHLLNREADLFEKKNLKIYRIHENFRYYYRMQENTQLVNKINKKGFLFNKVKVRYHYNDRAEATHIRLKHKGLVRLKIEFTHLPATAP